MTESIDNQRKEILRKLRKSANLTQEEVATAIGRTRSAYAKWEDGKSSPAVEDIKNLGSFYKVTIDEIIGAKPSTEAVDASKPGLKNQVVPEIDNLDIPAHMKLELYQEYVLELRLDIEHLNNKLRLREKLFDKIRGTQV